MAEVTIETKEQTEQPTPEETTPEQVLTDKAEDKAEEAEDKAEEAEDQKEEAQAAAEEAKAAATEATQAKTTVLQESSLQKSVVDGLIKLVQLQQTRVENLEVLLSSAVDKLTECLTSFTTTVQALQTVAGDMDQATGEVGEVTATLTDVARAIRPKE